VLLRLRPVVAKVGFHGGPKGGGSKGATEEEVGSGAESFASPTVMGRERDNGNSRKAWLLKQVRKYLQTVFSTEGEVQEHKSDVLGADDLKPTDEARHLYYVHIEMVEAQCNQRLKLRLVVH
jgi:hypothetical protein